MDYSSCLTDVNDDGLKDSNKDDLPDLGHDLKMCGLHTLTIVCAVQLSTE